MIAFFCGIGLSQCFLRYDMKLNLEFQTLTATIGAESIGGDLKKILMTDSNYDSTCLREALVKHKVLVFRDQHPDSNTHI